jgi:hypothetical protein
MEGINPRAPLFVDALHYKCYEEGKNGGARSSQKEA